MQFAPQTKAGEERSFPTVETNLLPGRAFISLEDLNRQALESASCECYLAVKAEYDRLLPRQDAA